MQFKTQFMATAAALTLFGVSAQAQQAPAPAAAAQASVAAGVTVHDTTGGEVGRVESVSGGNAVVDTGTHKVALPLTSFATGANGPIISMTKAQLDQAAAGAQQQQQAQTEANTRAALQPGATVHDTAGGEVGMIKSVDAQYAVVNTTKHEVRLPLNAFASGSSGPIVGMTRDQLDAAAAGAAPAGGPPPGR